MNKTEYTISDRHVTVYTGQIPSPVFIYANIFAEEGEELASLVPLDRMTLVTIDSVEWDRDFSPWPAEKVFPQGEDFSGGGPAYLKTLTKDIIPAVEEGISIVPAKRILAGYSLAGLFALYGVYETTLFQGAVCASPSLWYDQWLDYMERYSLPWTVQKVYFSLGDRESKTKNKRLAMSQTCIEKGKAIIARKGIATTFILNKGNHFVDSMPRLAKGIRWIIEE